MTKFEKLDTAAHNLMPTDIVPKVPALYTNANAGTQALALVKLFTPWSNWTWYISEYDPETRRCFGLVVGFEREFGYFSIPELEELSGPIGLRVERDLYWTPRPLKECR